MTCRHCGTPLIQTFLDLGFAPPSNGYLRQEDLEQPEIYYPLKVKVCERCWLVQTQDYAQVEVLFGPEYAYFSSTSTSWLAHAENYSEDMTRRFGLDTNSMVIEIASNDGYLLKNFVRIGIPCLGIEPTISTAIEAEKIGIPVIRDFFSEELAKRLAKEDKKADLIIGNNVYAHVPKINDFTKGLKALLRSNGTITLEFPHLMRLIEHVQFDTVYHEHFSYLSLFTVKKIFESVELKVWDVEELPTHGGSIRVYGCHMDDARHTKKAVECLLRKEAQVGMQSLKLYAEFQARVSRIKNDFLDFLIRQKNAGKTVVAYGAAAKGNTLLNYAGVKPDLLSLIFDAALAKQNKYMPGSHIPILSPNEIIKSNPDYVVILPWNIAEEVKKSLGEKLGSAKYVTVIPKLNIS